MPHAQGDCTAADPYYDYEGSLRGVAEGACDVSFTKHSTALTYLRDGKIMSPTSHPSAYCCVPAPKTSLYLHKCVSCI